MRKKQYFCIVFFMVLDLRLMEIGLSRDNPSFFKRPPSADRREAALLKMH